LQTFIAKKKPLLSERHKAHRLAWSAERQNWSQQQWDNVIFSDEVPLHIIQTHSRRYIKRLRHSKRGSQAYRPTVQKGGGTVMVWGAVSSTGVLPLQRIQGTLNGPKYTNVLEVGLLPHMQQHPNHLFQQDNASCHTARYTRNWMAHHHINTIDWPPMSPDLNIIENMWSELKRQLDAYNFCNATELFERASQLWANMPAATVRNLYNSLPTRISECIRSRGGHTHY
jgi:transposase